MTFLKLLPSWNAATNPPLNILMSKFLGNLVTGELLQGLLDGRWRRSNLIKKKRFLKVMFDGVAIKFSSRLLRVESEQS